MDKKLTTDGLFLLMPPLARGTTVTSMSSVVVQQIVSNTFASTSQKEMIEFAFLHKFKAKVQVNLGMKSLSLKT